jgi:CubicO group peptidase (beta-lactamase class C family)
VSAGRNATADVLNVKALTAVAVMWALSVLVAGAGAAAAASSSRSSAIANKIESTIQDAVLQDHLRAVIVRVTKDGKNVITRAYGESMTGVPATTAMHFRNGAVAISYVANLLLQLVDDKKVSLDDKVSKFLPDIPNADRVTLGQLAEMTSGYADYVVQSPEIISEHYDDVFRTFSPQELIAAGTSHPLAYEPGTGWNYAHTNYVILGLALEKATGQKMSSLLQQRVLGPLGLKNTSDPGTPEIQEPALHAGSSERRGFYPIPASTPFYEDSTYWDPSWTITHGAVETTNIFDLDKTAIAIGTGKLLSAASHKAMVSKARLGLGEDATPACPTCRKLSATYTFGIGVVISGDWLLQNPAFSGYSAVEAYLPSDKLAVSVAVTYEPGAYDEAGEVPNQAVSLFRAIGAVVAPGNAPPK